MCIPSLNTTWIAATTFASLKYSAFMKLIMVHWCGGFGDEQCWVVLWTPELRPWLYYITCIEHSCYILDRCGEI